MLVEYAQRLLYIRRFSQVLYSPTWWYYISRQLWVSFRYQRFPRSLPSVKALQDGFTLSNAQAKGEFDRRNFESESAVKLKDCYCSPMSSLQVTSLVRRWCQQNLLPFILHFILELFFFLVFRSKAYFLYIGRLHEILYVRTGYANEL